MVDYQIAMSREHAVGVARKARSVWTRLVREVCVPAVDLELHSALEWTESVNNWQIIYPRNVSSQDRYLNRMVVQVRKSECLS